MQDSIIYFLAILVFSVPIGFSVYSFAMGKFPAKGGPFGNYVIFGDRNVDPKLLSGNRARFLSVLLFLIFGLLIIVLANNNDLLGNITVSNLVPIILGVVGGIILCKKMISL